MKSLGVPGNINGVYVSDVSNDGGAYAAGIRKGDVITKVNNQAVASGLQMSAQLASFRPGDKVPISYIRNGKESATTVTLKKKTEIIADIATTNISSTLGAELTDLDRTKARQYGVEGGVVVGKITDGGPIGRTRMQPGFIITSVNGTDITSLDQLTKVLANAAGSVRLEGIYPGYDGIYQYPLNLAR